MARPLRPDPGGPRGSRPPDLGRWANRTATSWRCRSCWDTRIWQRRWSIHMWWRSVAAACAVRWIHCRHSGEPWPCTGRRTLGGQI